MPVEKLSDFTIKNNQRVFVAGKTGSGKTSLTQALLYPIKRLLLIDSKDDLFDWNTVEAGTQSINKIQSGEPVRVRVTNRELALVCLEAAYLVGNIIIYVDEVTALIPERSKPEPIFNDIWMRGRSRNIGAWSTAQRPTSIPLMFMSEAEHYFMFRLNLEDDRKRMAQFMGKGVLNPIPDRFGFYYSNIFNEKIRYYKRLNI